MKWFKRLLIVAALAAGVCGYRYRAEACPFCSAPSLTLSEQLAQSDAIVLVQWTEATQGKEDRPGSTAFEVVQVVKVPTKRAEKPSDEPAADAQTSANSQASRALAAFSPEQAKDNVPASKSDEADAAKYKLAKGDKITLTQYRSGKKGNLFLLTGLRGVDGIEWNSPMEVTETSFNYIVQAPSPETAKAKRLTYFMKFLEYPDEMISNDAYSEFAGAAYSDLVPLADQMPRDKLRQWIVSDDTSVTRLGLYGLMLGLCGKEEDAQLMKEQVTKPADDFRLGIDGVMGGYLLLTGEDGLKVLEEVKLRDKKVPFSETYAVMQALRFMWEYSDGKIAKPRLRESMRLLLDRPELADMVIPDLARWEDWEVQDRLMHLYGEGEYNIPSIKRAIVRFMMASAKFKPSGEGQEPPAHVTSALEHLKTLREKDPKTVQEAELYRFLN
jgi:hypothetical protein